jgi:cytochrome c biogenesis protein ResB
MNGPGKWMVKKGVLPSISSLAVCLLMVSTFLGWLLSEFIPSNLFYRKGYYSSPWREVFFQMMDFLKPYDPFHSCWHVAALLFLFLVTVICVLVRVRKAMRRESSGFQPMSAGDLRKGDPYRRITWGEMLIKKDGHDDFSSRVQRFYPPQLLLNEEKVVKAFNKLGNFLSNKRYRVVSTGKDGGVLFISRAGGWKWAGSLIFHAGILVLAVGGMLGSFMGSAELIYGEEGEVFPLDGGRGSVLVENFDLFESADMGVEAFATDISILDSKGDTAKVGRVEVNHPLKFEGYSIYQSSYHLDEKRFRWADIVVVDAERGVAKEIRIRPGEEAIIDGGRILRASGFFPDFRMTPVGPYSAGSMPDNPALKIEIVEGKSVESGWLFLFHPRYDSEFELTSMKFRLADVAPVFYSGLEIRRNTGDKVVFAGMIITIMGLLLMYCSNYRVIGGKVDREGLTMAGLEFLWKASFRKEFDNLIDSAGDTLSDLLPDGGID